MSPKGRNLFELPARAMSVAAGRAPPSWARFEAVFFVHILRHLKMASLKQNGRRRGFSQGRFQATDWRSRGALFKRAFPSLPLAGATDTSFFFFFVLGSPPWLSVCVRLLLRSCVFLDGPCFHFVPVVFPRDRDAWRLSSETIDATSFWKP